MKECTESDYFRILDAFNQRELDRTGSFSRDAKERLSLTLRSRKMPVFPHRIDFLDIESGGSIPLEERVEVIADSISKPMWEVYAIYDPIYGKHYYDYNNLYLQSLIELEPWQKQADE